MKKLILSAAALFAFGFANAQDDAATGSKGFANGDVFISGSVGFSSETEGEFKSSTFSIMPKLGFFVADNIAIGGMIGYMGTTDEMEVGSVTFEEKMNTLAVGGFARYYATPASDFSFFGELGVTYMSSTFEEEDAEEFKVNGFGIAVSPGVSYFISDNFAMEASIGALEYTTMKPDADGAESRDTFGLNLNLTDITFGLVYKF